MKVILQVAPDLCRDRRDGRSGELLAAPWVEPLDCPHEPNRPRLQELVVLRAGSPVGVGEGLDERQVELDEPVASAQVAVIAIRGEETSGCRLAQGGGDIADLTPDIERFARDLPSGSRRGEVVVRAA
jgi:hypothetical protein